MAATSSETRADNVIARRKAIARRHIEHVRNGTTDFHPAGARWLHAREFLDPTIFGNERKLLRTVPLVACHSGQLPEPKTFQAEMVLDVPVLLIRQEDGSVKAFLNSCSHRGARLCEGGGKVRNRIFCPYHSWGYGLDGSLESIMQEDRFGEVDRASNSLVELPCDERYGLVFVVLDPDGEMDLDTFLGGFAEHLDIVDLPNFEVQQTRYLDHDINWKLALSGYLESYHVATVHAKTLGWAIKGNVSTHDQFGPDGQHILTTWAMNSIEELAEQEGDVDSIVADLDYSPFNVVLYLWPNTIITAPDFIRISHLVRLMPGKEPFKQRTDFRILHPKDMGEDERKIVQEFDAATIVALEEEDYGLALGIQEGVSTWLRGGVITGANEPSVLEMHRGFARATGRPGPDEEIPKR